MLSSDGVPYKFAGGRAFDDGSGTAAKLLLKGRPALDDRER
jgi:hypothetical protein